MIHIPLKILSERGFDLKFSKSGNFVKITDCNHTYERKVYRKGTKDAFVIFRG